MNLYQTKYFDPNSSKGDGSLGSAVEAAWSGTQAQASKDRVSLKKNGMMDIETVDTEVPTNKKDLLAFLNDNKVVVK